MTSRYIGAALWAVFALALAVIAYQLLWACDLGRPLFGLRYCKAQAAPQALDAAEKDKERSLRDRLRQAELRLAQLPPCAERSEPPKRDETIEKPEPKKEETKNEDAPPQDREALKFPTKKEDLKGCWQSDSGDIEMYTDEQVKKFAGKVRICLCFRANGVGQIRYLYTNGNRCQGPLTSTIESDKFTLKHNKVPCSNRTVHVNPADYTCTRGAEGGAVCDTYSYSRFDPGITKNEKYHKVDDSLCEWRG